MGSRITEDATTDVAADPVRSSRLAVAAAFVSVALVAVAFAVGSWIGAEPFGSDNDEYRLAARSLLKTGRASVGGVEATKYPWGYPSLLAGADGAGLPVTTSAIALNLLLVVILVFVTVRTLWRYGGLASTLAGALIASSGTLWLSAQTVMPDVALTIVVAAGLFLVLEKRPARPQLIYLTVLAALAVAMKAVGIAFALSATGVLIRRGARLRSLFPLAAGTLMLVIPLMLSGSLPEHATGYERTLRLSDPFDLSKGELGLTGLAERSIRRLGSVGTDLGRGLFASGDDPGAIRVIAAAFLVVFGTWAGRRRSPIVVPFAIVYTLVIVVWPYSSSRFGLPYLPIAGLGLAALIGGVRGSHRTKVMALVAGCALASNAILVLPTLDTRAEAIAARRHGWADDSRKLQRWVTAHVARTDDIVSFDYRELMLRFDRPIRPLPYTSDDAHLMTVLEGHGAEWFVASTGIIPERTRYGHSLVATFAARFQKTYGNETFSLYKVVT